MNTISVPNEILIPRIAEFIAEGHTATFRVKGRSMRAFLEDGRDQVVLSPFDAGRLRRGDVVLAEVAPRCYVLHRIVAREGDRLTLRGDGNIRGCETCRVSDVLGLASGFLRKGRQTPDRTDGLKWRIYSALWPQNPFLRRLALAAYRRLYLRFTHQNPIK
ncbi:MAG: S24/S26 family peptidase [Prevotellaceae bacterium]|nr:S24/S26 family peptidase [Prevotellaceae bacterium]